MYWLSTALSGEARIAAVKRIFNVRAQYSFDNSKYRGVEQHIFMPVRGKRWWVLLDVAHIKIKRLILARQNSIGVREYLLA
jgi:hypothetical protein